MKRAAVLSLVAVAVVGVILAGFANRRNPAEAQDPAPGFTIPTNPPGAAPFSIESSTEASGNLQIRLVPTLDKTELVRDPVLAVGDRQFAPTNARFDNGVVVLDFGLPAVSIGGSAVLELPAVSQPIRGSSVQAINGTITGPDGTVFTLTNMKTDPEQGILHANYEPNRGTSVAIEKAVVRSSTQQLNSLGSSTSYGSAGAVLDGVIVLPLAAKEAIESGSAVLEVVSFRQLARYILPVPAVN